jgi:hypothetical protein
LRITNKRRAAEAGAVIFILVALAIGYLPVLSAFRNETASRKFALRVGNRDNPDHVLVTASVLSIDPLKGDMTIRLNMEPKGAWVNADNLILKRDLTLFLNTASGSIEHAFLKGKPMSPFETTLALGDG